MPDNSHYIKIMEAASPYLNSSMQKQIQLMIQANELLCSMHKKPSEFSALEAAPQQPDIEHMLEHILPVCNSSEQAMIHKVLNVARAGRLFKTYQSFQKQSQDNAESSMPFQDFMMSQLTPEQQETLKTFQSILSS